MVYAGDANHCHSTLRILFSSHYKEKNVMMGRKYAFQRFEVIWKKLWPGTSGRGYERKPAMMNGPMKDA